MRIYPITTDHNSFGNLKVFDGPLKRVAVVLRYPIKIK
jgi:hypothetical protein